MVQLKKEVYKNKVVKHTIANSRGGRNINMESLIDGDLQVISTKFVVSEGKKVILSADNLGEAIEAFNKMEEESQGKNTKVAKENQKLLNDINELRGLAEKSDNPEIKKKLDAILKENKVILIPKAKAN